MDQQTLERATIAMLDELTAIQKHAGIGSFLRGGLRGFGQMASGKGIAAAAKNVGGHGALAKRIYKGGKGAKQGVMAGVGRLAKSRYGQMAAVGAVPVAAGVAAGRATAPSGRY
jgi:hypothetical protein